MQLQHATNIIRAHFQASVASPLGLPAVFDDAEEPKTEKPWFRLQTAVVNREQIYLGIKWYRIFAVAVVNLYAPPSCGGQLPDAYTQKILTEMSTRKIGGVTLLTATDPQSVENPAYYQIVTSCPFRYEEHDL